MAYVQVSGPASFPFYNLPDLEWGVLGSRGSKVPTHSSSPSPLFPDHQNASSDYRRRVQIIFIFE